MTIPFFIEDPITHVQTEVPQEILYYCDNYTVDAHREDLRYFDCVSMHMGYYGNDPKRLKRIRDHYRYEVNPVFD
jgi:hypothetical protein